jgi:hypothetical protein
MDPRVVPGGDLTQMEDDYCKNTLSYDYEARSGSPIPLHWARRLLLAE